MPHNLYLHSSIVQTRKIENTIEGKRSAIRFATIDSTVALMLALFVNAAILILSAAAFHTIGREVTEIQDAYQLLAPTLRNRNSQNIFAVALLSFRTQFYINRYSGWSNCHGRIFEHSA